MSVPVDPPRDDALLAAEHALSLLQGAERVLAERRMLDDPGFRAEVEAWQESFAVLDGEFAEVTPRAAVRKRLMARVFGGGASGRIWPWQAFGLGSFALAAALAVVLFAPVIDPPPAPPQDLAVFDISGADGSLTLLATLDHVTRVLYFSRAAGAAAPGRALELWAIQGGNPPVSLGVLPESPNGTVRIPEGIGAEGLVLAISDEPEGGSPTGAPTGAILATGQVVEL